MHKLRHWLSLTFALLSGCVSSGGERTIKTHGQVVWKGLLRESKGPATVGMHASASRKVEELGVKVVVEGQSEPLLYSTSPGATWLNEISVGDEVKVTLWERGSLFGRKTDIVGISKGEARR